MDPVHIPGCLATATQNIDAIKKFQQTALKWDHFWLQIIYIEDSSKISL